MDLRHLLQTTVVLQTQAGGTWREERLTFRYGLVFYGGLVVEQRGVDCSTCVLCPSLARIALWNENVGQ